MGLEPMLILLVGVRMTCNWRFGKAAVTLFMKSRKSLCQLPIAVSKQREERVVGHSFDVRKLGHDGTTNLIKIGATYSWTRGAIKA
jgi:hypothetical protein